MAARRVGDFGLFLARPREAFRATFVFAAPMSRRPDVSPRHEVTRPAAGPTRFVGSRAALLLVRGNLIAAKLPFLRNGRLL